MRRCISVLLVLACVLSCIPMAVGAVEPQNTAVENIYGVDESYSVTIPATLTTTALGATPQNASVTVSDVLIPYGTKLAVNIGYSGKLELESNSSIELEYEMYRKGSETDEKISNGDALIEVEAGTVESQSVTFYSVTKTAPMYSGKYGDTVTFTVGVKQPITNYTAEEIEADDHIIGIGKTKRENVVAVFNEDYTEVVISKNGEEDNDGLMADWISPTDDPFANPMWTHRDTITDIDVQEGVASIGSLAFCRCAQWAEENVYIPTTVTYIGDQAFRGCENLTGKLTFPKNCERIGESSFTITNFEEVDLGGLKEVGSWAFYDNLSISKVDLSDVEVLQECAFYKCKNIAQELVIPDTCEFIGPNVFDSDTGITKLTLGNSLEHIGSCAFQGCCNIEQALIIPDSCKFIGAFAFNGNGKHMKITSLTLGNSVEYIGAGAFQHCENVTTELVFPESLKAICDFAFNRCQHFSNETLNIPKNVQYIGGDGSGGLYPSEVIDAINIDNYMDQDYKDIGTHTFMAFARNYFKEFTVDEENQYFTAKNTALYSKDGKRLLCVPNNGNHAWEMPEGTLYSDEMSMCLVYDLTLADSYVIRSCTEARGSSMNGANTLFGSIYRLAPWRNVRLKETNTRYMEENGNIYSADGKTCYLYHFDENKVATIREGCENVDGLFIDEEAFIQSPAGAYTINIPASVTSIISGGWSEDTTDWTIEDYENAAMNMINDVIDASRADLTINIDSGNPVYTTDGSGHIVKK